MLEYIFNSMKNTEKNFEIICRNLKRQKSFNKSVVFFSFSVAAYAFTNEIEKRSQAMRIKNLEKEIENINNRNNEPGDEM